MSIPTQTEIQLIINKQILKPVRIIDAEYHRVRDFNESDVIQLEGLNVGLYKAFGWLGANPNSESKKRLSRIFYTLDQLPPTISASSLPTKKGLDSLIELLTTGERVDEQGKYSDIFIIGARGSGKSASMNYIFNSRFDELIEKHTTLFRADIAKLHTDINVPRHMRNEGPVSITKYVILHAFMVALEYSNGKERALRQFYPYKNAQIRDPSTLFDTKFLNTKEQREGWENIVSAYRELDHKTSIKNSDLIWFIDKTNKVISTELAVDLWDSFCRFLKSPQGGGLNRIVLIFDGVDNLRTDQFTHTEINGKSNHKWYEDYLKELIQYYRRQAQIARADQFVYSFRNSTWKDFGSLTFQALGHGDHQHLVVSCVPQRPARIFLKRLLNYTHTDARDLVVDSRGYNDPSGQRSASNIEQKIHRIRRSLTKNTTRLLYIFADELYKYTGSQEKPWNRAEIVKNLIQYVFNGNIRSFLRNMILSHVAVEEYNNHQRTPITAEHRFETSILAGNFLFPPNLDENLKGRWCPNLFEIGNQQENGKWTGLSCIRMLQILPYENTDTTQRSLTFVEIKDFLLTLGYEEKTIALSAQILYEFGLIQLREGLSGSNARYYKTHKGKFIQWLIFNNLSVFYLMAVSSKFSRPIDTKPFTNEKVDGVWIHKKNSPRFFIIAAARTSVQFLRSIKSLHSYEQVILEGATTTLQHELKKYIIEPDVEGLIENLSTRLRGVGVDYEEELLALKREWTTTAMSGATDLKENF